MSKVICYVRESTSDQELGLEAQRTRLESECSYRGWSDPIFIEDAGYSARSLNRPGIQRALSMLAEGFASVLVVTKLDRLSRSVIDFAALLALAERQGWALVVLDLGLDLTTPNGKFVASIMASVAELERNLISERTRQALAVKRASGVKLGRPTQVPAHVREFITQARAEEYSLAQIADILTQKEIPTAQGGKRWYPSTISAILASK